MALFGFSITGPRRNPTADERANGFPCGAADQTLFNGLQHRVEAELSNLITFAGLTPTDTDFTQVRQAIQALIDAATGGGDTDGYLLLSQAASRLPIFPEFLTVDGKINVTSPATGTVRVPAGVTFMHRGIVPIVTAQTDFATVSSRTYHLRWNPTDGFTLKNVGDSGYNPGGLAEGNVAFDTTYDDMLVARIITNAGNVATITNLANKDRLDAEGETVAPGPAVQDPGSFNVFFTFDLPDLNWARRPRIHSILPKVGSAGSAGGLDGAANVLQSLTLTRYKAGIVISSDFAATGSSFYASAWWNFAL